MSPNTQRHLLNTIPTERQLTLRRFLKVIAFLPQNYRDRKFHPFALILGEDFEQ